MNGPPELIHPSAFGRAAALPPLGMIPAGSLPLSEVAAVKQREQVPVQVVFPVGGAREADNLACLLAIIQPLMGTLVDQVWLALGGKREGNLPRVAAAFPGVKIFPARRQVPPDQRTAPMGKGATMRALLHHLVTVEHLTHPRAVIQFLDADIRPAYFHARWVVDAVGAILWYRTVEAAKIVYHRPRGGRLNTMLRSLIALCPHPGVQSLQKLAYLLSGEMAGTLHFWTSVPFKSGYGVEILVLMSLALNHLRLAPGTADLDHLVQVYVGEMDHRHAPLTSTPKRRGLDQMAGGVFLTLMEILEQAGILNWHPAAVAGPVLRIPLPGPDGGKVPGWMEVPLGDQTLAPLSTCPEVRAALRPGGP